MRTKNCLVLLVLLIFTACTSSAAPVNGELQDEELLRTLEMVTESAKKHDAEGARELLAYSKHPDYLIRIRAIKALSEDFYRGDDSAYAALVTALDDDYWLVRAFAARGLGKDDRQEVQGALTRRLKVEDNERVVRHLQKALDKVNAKHPLPNGGF